MSPKPSALAMPSCGVPEAGVSVNRLSPIGCRPALLMKRVSVSWPSTLGVVEPVSVADTLGYGSMTQGSLEQANVDVVSEMSDLIAAQRAYEMNAKVISAADQMLQSTTALFR